MRRGTLALLTTLTIMASAQTVQAHGFGIGASSLHAYFSMPSADRVDWQAYYRSTPPPGGGQRIQYAPQFVSPTMQWAVPNSCLNGPPSGPPYPPPAAYGPATPGYNPYQWPGPAPVPNGPPYGG